MIQGASIPIPSLPRSMGELMPHNFPQPLLEIREPLVDLCDNERWHEHLGCLNPDEHDEKLQALRLAAIREAS